MKRNHLKILFVLFATAIVTAQVKYPADTLLISNNINIIKKFGILPISTFQRLSYNSEGINCQFFPSCSNYGAKAIADYGLIRGGFMASDRIVRCNPMSVEKHLQHGGEFRPTDLRLIDPVRLNATSESNKSPLLAASLSALIPGTGRIYNGRWFDGIMGLSQFVLMAAITNYAYQNNNDILTGITGGITFFVYGGEVYGAYRTAKYY